ncbi:MAG: AAA family ATPase, partial [Myxococcota bacterium]|nr:AAA family ATPase [Myxococcota bacterium]
MEHLAHFGLSQDPFRNEPQLDFHFEASGHREARLRLLRCLRQGKELAVLVGTVGSGKTLLVRSVFEELDPDRFEVGLLVLARGVEPDSLRAAVAHQLGVEEPASERAEGVPQLFQRLVEIRGEGRRAVVLIDEAHALRDGDCLAELRSLLNFEHDEQRLLSVVLVGAPALEQVLAQDPVLPGRIELQIALTPLAGAEAQAYLAHRIERAGGDPALFAPEVAASIAERAGGVPRRMNTLADGTLFEAHLAGRAR